MKKVVLFFFTVLLNMCLVSLFLSCTTTQKMKTENLDNCQIHYLQFNIRTFLPVTIENIEKYGKLKKNITNSKHVSLFRQLINPVEIIQFNHSMVRAKLIFPDNIYYIDEKGYSIDTSGNNFYVDPVYFEMEMKKIFRNTKHR